MTVTFTPEDVPMIKAELKRADKRVTPENIQLLKQLFESMANSNLEQDLSDLAEYLD